MNPYLEALICEREALVARVKGMEAENAARLHRGETPVYTEDNFLILSAQLDGLAIAMRNL